MRAARQLLFAAVTVYCVLFTACSAPHFPTLNASSTPAPLRRVDVTSDCLPVLGDLEEWTHPARARRARRFGEPHHSTQGPIAVTGTAAQIHAKFAYGLYSKDLEDEVVRTFVRTGECAWSEAERSVTNDDGRAALALPILPVGVYDYRVVVAGDHSWTRGVIAVLEANSDVVVFDVDGTLTSDGELFDQLFYGDIPPIEPYAAAVAQHYAAQGIQAIYLTGRAYHLQGRTAEWLDLMRLPRGPLHTTDSVEDAMPGAAVEAYKLAFLQRIEALGLHVVTAYGNASSDVCAYARAGVNTDHTFIIGPHAGSACEGFGPTQALHRYGAHLQDLHGLDTQSAEEPAPLK